MFCHELKYRFRNKTSHDKNEILLDVRHAVAKGISCILMMHFTPCNTSQDYGAIKTILYYNCVGSGLE